MSATTGRISIASSATVIGLPVEIVSASFSLASSTSTGLIKKVLKKTRNKKKKHSKIVMLARTKLNSIENKICKVLADNEIRYEDFETIIDEEKSIKN